jgi:pyrroline-5-carboxylate reductase
MAGAILSRWLADKVAMDVTIIKPSPPKSDVAQHVKYVRHVSASESDAHIILIGVKPQMMPLVLPEVMAHYGSKPLYVTMAAGLPHAYYTAFHSDARWLRIMPNTPVAIGEGVISCYVPENTQHPYLPIMESLLNRLGVCCWLKDEALFDVATALAGSGPAYAYLFIEALMQAGQTHGLDANISRVLATHMMKGAASYAAQTDTSLETLREKVTSKGGTTAAALSIFMQDDALFQMTQHAIDAAIDRAKHLASPQNTQK